jgi:hypothetical protein
VRELVIASEGEAIASKRDPWIASSLAFLAMRWVPIRPKKSARFHLWQFQAALTSVSASHCGSSSMTM